MVLSVCDDLVTDHSILQRGQLCSDNYSPGLIKEKIIMNGFAHVPGILDREIISELYQKVLNQLSRLNFCIHGTNEFNSAQLSKSELTSGIVQARAFLEREPALHDLANTPLLLKIIGHILKSEVFVHPRRFLRVGLPDRLYPEETTAFHQDYRYVQGAVDTLTVWIPLADYSLNDGILAVTRNSHKAGLHPVLLNTDRSFSFHINNTLPDTTLTSVKRGDCVIFHSLTVHGAHKNITNSIRLSVDFRYQRSSDLLSRSMLIAPFTCRTEVDPTKPQEWSGDKRFSLPDTIRLCDPVPFGEIEIAEPSKLLLGI
jgi:hypothetical protein